MKKFLGYVAPLSCPSMINYDTYTKRDFDKSVFLSLRKFLRTKVFTEHLWKLPLSFNE